MLTLIAKLKKSILKSTKIMTEQTEQIENNVVVSI